MPTAQEGTEHGRCQVAPSPIPIPKRFNKTRHANAPACSAEHPQEKQGRPNPCKAPETPELKDQMV